MSPAERNAENKIIQDISLRPGAALNKSLALLVSRLPAWPIMVKYDITHKTGST